MLRYLNTEPTIGKFHAFYNDKHLIVQFESNKVVFFFGPSLYTFDVMCTCQTTYAWCEHIYAAIQYFSSSVR